MQEKKLEKENNYCTTLRLLFLDIAYNTFLYFGRAGSRKHPKAGPSSRQSVRNQLQMPRWSILVLKIYLVFEERSQKKTKSKLSNTILRMTKKECSGCPVSLPGHLIEHQSAENSSHWGPAGALYATRRRISAERTASTNYSLPCAGHHRNLSSNGPWNSEGVGPPPLAAPSTLQCLIRNIFSSWR